jgi:hypothetical protein
LSHILHRLGRIARDKHSSLLGAFMSYEKNEVLWICHPMFLEE